MSPLRLILCVLPVLMPLPAFAETLSLTSHVTAVTVYPQAAEVTRSVAFTAPAAGGYDLVIPDLPADAVAEGIRFAASQGVMIDAFALRSDRLPPMADATSPALVAARTALDAAEADLAKAEGDRDAILAKVEAAQAQVAFLAGVKLDGAALTPAALAALTGSVGDLVLTARRMALAARAEAIPASKAVETAQKARDDAQAALDALSQPVEDRSALTLSVEVAAAGPVSLSITHLMAEAGWRPAYALALDDKSSPAVLTLDRGALVSQVTGEDWAGIALTLSTARPSDQAAPSVLYPVLRSISDPDQPVPQANTDAMAEFAPVEPAPAVAGASMSKAVADFQGVAVVYHLPKPVSVASGVEDLRLELDRLTFAPDVVAEAVPSRDATGFVVAAWVNDSQEILLPGEGLVSRDGTLVGGLDLPMIAPGDKTRSGFGAIDGLKLTRIIPDASQGEHGVFTTSTERRETAVLKVENLTGQLWPVRLLDQVPYSEQDDLTIDWSADPAPAETDVEDQRGILAWTFDLAPGASQQVTLSTRLSWPAGKVLN